MRSYYTLCAHIRVPSLPLKKDRYKPERNGSPNVPLILQVRLALLRAFLKPPERRQHVADQREMNKRIVVRREGLSACGKQALLGNAEEVHSYHP